MKYALSCCGGSQGPDGPDGLYRLDRTGQLEANLRVGLEAQVHLCLKPSYLLMIWFEEALGFAFYWGGRWSVSYESRAQEIEL